MHNLQTNLPARAGLAIENLTEAQAAEFLNLSPLTLRDWRLKGGGPTYSKLGGRLVRYRRADLDAFVTAGVRRHTSEVRA